MTVVLMVIAFLAGGAFGLSVRWYEHSWASAREKERIRRQKLGYPK